jgi:hypothetical protein
MALFLAHGCYFWFLGILGAEVDDAQDDSWRHSFVAWLYLAAKPSHVGVDEGTGPPARRYLVLPLQWVVAPFWGM